MNTDEKRQRLEAAGYIIGCEYDGHSYAFQGMVTSANGVVGVTSNWHYVPKEESRKNNFEPFKQAAMNEAIEKVWVYFQNSKLLENLQLRVIAYQELEAVFPQNRVTQQRKEVLEKEILQLVLRCLQQ